ncbi:phosphoribosylamine--glycine ligase [Acetobacteraceae bacterium]|nr:phosphoribosylamine--glycine ligase [Candidatus Parcubacteria bacterium]
MTQTGKVVFFVGSGGREDASAFCTSRSPQVGKIYVAPGNGGTQRFGGIRVDVKPTDIEGIVTAAKERKTDLLFVGPEVPLVAGLVDAAVALGIPTFGPDTYCSQLEGDKIFTMIKGREWDVAIPDFGYTGTLAGIEEFLADPRFRVVKRRGLRAGKGVTVAETKEEAFKAARTIIENGELVLFQERLSGREASAMRLSDGLIRKRLLPARDYKRALNGDKGDMTGGMGAYAPVPDVTPEIDDRIDAEIINPTFAGLHREGKRFKGVLYAGTMLTSTGPKLLEYNVRFGDPEWQVLLRLLLNDPYEVLEACALGRLADITLRWRAGFAICVNLVAGGYPNDYRKGDHIYGLQDALQVPGVEIFHAGTVLKDGIYYTDGGRVLNVTAVGDTLEEARARVYEAINHIHFADMYYRTDIGLT